MNSSLPLINPLSELEVTEMGGYDPLSRATRASRTSLLTFCAIFLSVHLVTLENKQFVLFNVPIPSNFLPVALLIAIILLGVSFAIYAYDDVRSRETRTQTQAELNMINTRIEELDADINSDDGNISYLHSKYKMDHEVRKLMISSDTAMLEDAKYIASKHLTERHNLGNRKMTLQAAIEAPSFDPISSIRFWVVDLGIPMIAVVLVVLGWLERLQWLREILGIVAV